jgi:hypothetical protein
MVAEALNGLKKPNAQKKCIEKIQTYSFHTSTRIELKLSAYALLARSA